MNIGEKLRIFAKIKFGSVSKLAEALDMKTPSLYTYLNEESIPGGQLLKKLQNLGCDINWLLSDDENPPPETDALLKRRLAELEEENKRLRDSISRMVLLAEEELRKGKIKRRKK